MCATVRVSEFSRFVLVLVCQAVAQGAPTTFWAIDASDQSPFLDWLIALAASPTAPLVCQHHMHTKHNSRSTHIHASAEASMRARAPLA